METASLVVKQSTIPNAGNGLFAKRDFRKGELIGYIKGVPISDEEADEIANSDDPRKFYFLDLFNGKTLDTYGSKSLCIYANDAEGFTKVSGFKNNGCIGVTKNHTKGYITAISDIKAGDEIFLDYGEDYWNNITI